MSKTALGSQRTREISFGAPAAPSALHAKKGYRVKIVCLAFGERGDPSLPGNSRV